MSGVHNDNKQKKKVLEFYITMHLIEVPILAPELLYMYVHMDIWDSRATEAWDVRVHGAGGHNGQCDHWTTDWDFIYSGFELSREALKAWDMFTRWSKPKVGRNELSTC